MARLNEPPPPAGESVEALKRRFMRQNRELAKSNSSLNVRITNLEADRSQLLSENITLRDENNRLRQEIEKDYSKQALESARLVKEKLAAKVAELSDLMAEMEVAQSKPVERSPVSKTTRRRSFKRSPGHIQAWKSTLYGPDITGLAPIMEDKYFPRSTLDADDLGSILPKFGDVTESPELGPPPIAHFEPTDPVKQDTNELQERESQAGEETDGNVDNDTTADLFLNLETRRKRRPSSLTKDTTEQLSGMTMQEGNMASEDSARVAASLRIGAKRKLSARDEEESSTRTSARDKEGFSFNRKIAIPGEDNGVVKPGATSSEKTSDKPLLDRRRETPATNKHTRKALGEKTVNTDPVVSPIKPRNTGHLKSSVAVNDSIQKSKERDKPKEKPPLARTGASNKVEKVKQVTSETSEPPPITPAPQLFSPVDSQPPSQVPLGRDTPPPEDLSSTITDATRPSRRQRAQVSYAEPSLRDKMRRPGKELVAAVGANGKSVYVRGKTDADIGNEKSMVDIKKEDDSDVPSWNTLPVEKPHVSIDPSSPLGDKSSKPTNDLPHTVITDRRRRSSQKPSEEIISGSQSGVSQSTIAALVAGSQKRLSRAREAAEAQRRISGEGAGLGIYDFKDKSVEEAIKESDLPKSSKHSRRYSSMSEIKETKRKESVSGLARANNASAVSRPVKTSADRGESEGGLSLSRGERIATRRRSMMV